MSIKKTKFPNSSILYSDYKKYDYSDSYQGNLKDTENKISVIDLAKSFFTSGPKWIEKLFDLRNKIVYIFGLKTSGNKKQNKIGDLKFEENEKVGLFKVFHKTENELILGEDDKHLNFRVSLLSENLSNKDSIKNITITTAVMFNNWFGKLYFLPVKPFHKIIVRKMLKEMINNLKN